MAISWTTNQLLKAAFFAVMPAALALAHGTAAASCGSAFCTVNTYWDTQGLARSDRFTLDLRYSYARANRLKAGTATVRPALPSGSDEEIEDGRTVNRLLELEGEWSLGPHWNIALGVPVVMRDHAHTFDSSLASPFTQQARFTSLGDAHIVGKFRFESDTPFAGSGLSFGLKLPTGATDKTMTPPDPSHPGVPYPLERSAQPGTGSTDLILGGYRFGSWAQSDWGWFASAQLQAPLATRGDFRPARQLRVDLGLNYAFSQELVGLLQLNLEHRGRDGGTLANPASGGRSANLSPGMSYAIGPNTRVYGFIQTALYQSVNTDPTSGTGQLAAPWSAAVGISQSF